MNENKAVRILIADDNQSARRGLIALLNSFGHKQPLGFKLEIVGEAANGQEAIILAEELVPDLIFMDINMPIMNGLEATEIIKDKLGNIRVIVLTMHNDQQEAAIQRGADDFIEKGTDAQRIKQVLSKFLVNDR